MRRIFGKDAFTLVELIVVIGIITIVIGLLLPAVAKARRAGKMAVCLGNLRNYAVGEADYEAQNRGYLSTNYADLIPTGQNFARICTCPAVSDYVNLTEYPTDGSGPYFYAFNGWLTGPLSTLQMGSIRDTSEVILMADVIKVTKDGFYLTGNDGMQDPFWKTMSLTISEPTFHARHGAAGAVLWVDGHTSMEIATAVPSTAQVNPNVFGDLTQQPAFFNANHIGYLTRSPSDLNSMAAEYYFVSPKKMLALNSMTKLFSQIPYTNYYAPNPALW